MSHPATAQKLLALLHPGVVLVDDATVELTSVVQMFLDNVTKYPVGTHQRMRDNTSLLKCNLHASRAHDPRSVNICQSGLRPSL